MAPVFSRSTVTLQTLPMDVIIAISNNLSPSGKRGLMLSCKYLHDVVAPAQYRNLVVRDRRFGCCHYRNRASLIRLSPVRLLGCLLRSLSNPVRHYASFIKSFTYISHVSFSNLRGLPMLVEVLRATVSLRYLRIEICQESVPLFTGLLRRWGLIRDAFVCTGAWKNGDCLDITEPAPSTPLYLPALRGIRSCQPEIISQLARFRRLEQLSIDHCTGYAALVTFTRDIIASPLNGLTSLSITLDVDVATSPTVIHDLVFAFSVLECLAIRTEHPAGAKLLTVRLLCCHRCGSSHTDAKTDLVEPSARKQHRTTKSAQTRSQPWRNAEGQRGHSI